MEYYRNNQSEQAWVIMDTEKRLKNVDRSMFIFAAEAWKQHQEHGREFWSYSGLPGRQGLKYALLNDLNCLFKNELLAYEWRDKEGYRRRPEMVDTPMKCCPRRDQTISRPLRR